MTTSDQQHITSKDLYRFQIITGARLSPAGETIVFRLQRVDEKSQKTYHNLWIVPASGGQARQFTYGDQVDAQPVWSPDGKRIAFLSNRKDEKQPQIYIIPLDGGEARPLTDLKGEFGSLAWSPDGRRLACAFRKKDQEAIEREEDEQKKALGVVQRHITRLVFKADGYGFLPQERWHLWIIDAESGQVTQLTDGDKYDEDAPAWSPDGESIVFVSNRSAEPDRTWDEDDLWLISATGGDIRKIQGERGPKLMPRFSADGQWIAYYQEGPREALWQKTNLWLVPADGSGPPKNLTAPFDFQVGQETINDIDKLQMMPPAWSPDSQRLYFQVTEHGNTVLKSVAVGGDDLQDVVPGPGVVGDFTLDREGGSLAYLHGTMTGLAQVWLCDLATGTCRKLTGFNELGLTALDLGAVEEVWFKGADGDDLQGWIIKPPAFDESKKYPSILEIHGGPMAQYGNFFMHEFFYLAARGYVVHFCNPRGGMGYGEGHTKAIYNNWGSADYADLMAWTDWVAQKPYIDSQRMGVTGGSYGGYMTTWIIGHTDRFKAAVAQRSVSNFISMAGSTDLGNVWDSLFGAKGQVWEDVEHHWGQSPLKFIGKAKTPTLVIHSEQDYRCDIEQSEQIFVALKKLGVDTELVRFPAESHGLSREGRTDRRIARLKHILRWFDRYLK